MKQNCDNCQHLEHIDHTSLEIQDGGYCCNKRDYENLAREFSHSALLQSDRYRERPKSCHEPKVQKHFCNYCRTYTRTVDNDCVECELSKTNTNLSEVVDG